MIRTPRSLALSCLSLFTLLAGCNSPKAQDPLVPAALAADEGEVCPITGARLGDAGGEHLPAGHPGASAEACPINGGWPANELIQEGEDHFARLWQLTRGGENAEGYFNFAGDRLSLQARNTAWGIDCDRIYVMGGAKAQRSQVSNGEGTTTCAYFLPDDENVIFASTHGGMQDCPPPADHSEGYVWGIYPEHDIWVRNLISGELKPFISGPGYDAEATVSPTGERVVFTSTRSGDLELWTSDITGADLKQVTNTLGYDGGGFFSHDGKQIVFRTTAFTPGNEAEEQATYKRLLAQNQVRPHAMDLMLINADGTNRRRLTHLGKAAFAPFFFPDDSRVIFSSNFADEEQGRNFDLFAIDVDGGEVERITNYSGFDSFPIFSPSGRYLVFASNRGGTEAGETNLFIAEWR